MGDRASAARDAMGERAADAIALVKPKLRGVSHEWAFFLSLGLGVALIVVAKTPKATLAVAIYAVSLSALFGTSALYHRVNWTRPEVRRWMRRLDHSMIFFLIAGTYTPFALLVLERPARRRDPRRRLDRRDRRRDRRDDLDRPPEMGGGARSTSRSAGSPSSPSPSSGSQMGVAGTLLVAAGGLLYTAGAVVYATQRPTRARRLRLPRGLPRAGDRRRRCPVRGDRLLRPARTPDGASPGPSLDLIRVPGSLWQRFPGSLEGPRGVDPLDGRKFF